MEETLLLAVSGGADSMFMLDKYKKRNIVVAFVNYNKRSDSWKDEFIVTQFCKKHNIRIHKLHIAQDFEYKGNFQDIARKQRYDFFKTIYDHYHCSKLLTAHHKDDWLETAIMQKICDRSVLYYGIKQRNVINGMNIYRPFVHKYWKSDIEEQVKAKKIDYAVDYTNAQDIYTRNKLRNKIKILTKEEKQKEIQIFQLANKKFTYTSREVEKEIQFWRNNEFSCEEKILLKIKYPQYVLFYLLHQNFENIKLSWKKLASIWFFIISPNNRTSKYLLKTDTYLYKKKNKLILN
ncbi:tRNA lysidine(34) synthetase TilS [Mycoplasma miroungirhinis]|uniref:tRNA(Ile)-lysidine synthase n=1 Tax=Mycoplasma miroungirhinis TaxID=754516 RepID=A0A6M4JDC4_9MOLU|nr:tRNA lysidine(34) synthetase TilS [Mycoplasma miroungirhinis]QJR44325.1 tRNA lysidine(34) synthetase TilS [Mycoplasma miroungirhinis]